MTNAAQVQIGRVSLRRHAREHAITNNRARCGSGHGTVIGEPRTISDLADRPMICRRCRPYLRNALAEALQAATAAQGNAYREHEVARLQAATDATLTDTERAELDALAAGMAEFLATADVDANYAAAVAGTVAQAPTVMALPVDERPAAWQERREQRPRSLAELAAAMRAQHPQNLVPRPRRTRRTPIAA